jgi:glycosyltransferase involved in cell wall biosynthesis
MLPAELPRCLEMSMDGSRRSPAFGVVVPTFNRSELAPRAIRSVLRQTFTDFDLVVVDDGSTDDTPEVVATIHDPRLRLVRQENQGLSAARNAGAAVVAGEWLTFLDDDDEALPGWLELFRREVSDARCGVVCCGSVIVDEHGRTLQTVKPEQLGPAYDNQVCSLLAGTYAIRRELFDAVCGYVPGLRASHGTELVFRLLPHCVSRGLTVRSVSEPGVRIESRPPAQRNRGKPEVLFDGVTYILERHRDRIRQSPQTFADFTSIAGVNAARLGKYQEARRFLTQAIRAEPLAPRRWARLLLSLIPPLGDRVWRRWDSEVSTPPPNVAA